MRIINIFILCWIACTASAQNPIIKTRCTPDPAAYVYQDTVWIYTGHDEDTATFFHMPDWQLYSTTDMVNFTYRGTPLSTSNFSWARQGDGAWASQGICRNGKWYWYVAAQHRIHGIGVAVSNRPEGPYTDPLNAPLVPGELGFIDPTVFVDDDGKAYLFWGNTGLWYGELNDDMISFKDGYKSIDVTDTLAFGTPTNKELKTNYTEAPWIYKLGDTYYLEYAAGGIPEHWAYSTAKSIHGPWTYQGIIMNPSPNSFTIHGGSIRYHGRDFMFYHCGRLPWGGGFRRSTSIEEFHRASDGAIPFIPFTTAGVTSAVRNLNPFRRVEAETMADCKGLQTDTLCGTFHYVTGIDDGDWLKVRCVDFSSHAKKIEASLRARIAGRIDVYVDSLNSPCIASIEVKPTRDKWKTIKAKIKNAPLGVHDLYFVFHGKGQQMFDFDYWKMYY